MTSFLAGAGALGLAAQSPVLPPVRSLGSSACRCGEGILNIGARIIVFSDRTSAGTWSGCDRVPIPSLLLTGAVHRHLIRAHRGAPPVAGSA